MRSNSIRLVCSFHIVQRLMFTFECVKWEWLKALRYCLCVLLSFHWCCFITLVGVTIYSRISVYFILHMCKLCRRHFVFVIVSFAVVQWGLWNHRIGCVMNKQLPGKEGGGGVELKLSRGTWWGSISTLQGTLSCRCRPLTQSSLQSSWNSLSQDIHLNTLPWVFTLRTWFNRTTEVFAR